ncbi:MAG: hypothetical protein QOE79_2385 [Sphingomonadales bacterium]|jgi:hypothetical protein|nr:hypothetical protein [Sphingomonadales bacterium]
MIELRADCFEDLCREMPVAAELAELDEKRSDALWRFWLWTGAGLILGPAACYVLWSTRTGGLSFIVGTLLLVVPTIVGYTALSRVAEGLKVPVLERIAARAGLEYMEKGFSPPVYPLAGAPLFGTHFSTESFTDLFHGKDEEGHGYAVYEATLRRRSGKNTHLVFAGQIYAVQRRPSGAAGETVIRPDRGLFNFVGPGSGMKRVELEANDPEFDRRFEAYSTEAGAARTLLLDGGLRRLLLDLRETGRVYAWIGSDDALVAVVGRNRFEPGSLLRRKPGRDRVRAMLDDVCAALATLREVKDRLG